MFLKRGGLMKCIACGREMIDRGTAWECSNFLCDYEEEIVAPEVLRKEQRVTHLICFYEPVFRLSFVYD